MVWVVLFSKNNKLLEEIIGNHDWLTIGHYATIDVAYNYYLYVLIHMARLDFILCDKKRVIN